jgi:lipoprotein-anchoring transpeptidase ErfK/SrfK
VVVLSACSSGGAKDAKTVVITKDGSTVAVTTSDTPSPTPKTKVPVHISLNIGDGAQVGIGLPIIATFKKKITDGRAFQDATKVTVNGKDEDARWYFEYSDPASGHVMEAHLRLRNYWPAHAQIHVGLAAKGKSAGGVSRHPNSQYVFDNSLTLDFETGASHIITVDDSTNTLTVMNDGQPWGKTFPVSLGDPKTPTKRGTKVIMEKVPTVCMHDIAGTYYECGIKDDQRLTYDGEYLHAAPWNTYNIDHGINTSNGCTNLHPTDAKTLYDFLGVGDVVLYPNASGPKMQMGQGYGDWNVSWGLWQTGGAIKT